MTWREKAACRGVDPSLFFSDGGRTSAAKKVCAGCDVQAECLQYAVENREWHGVWGGMSETQRLEMRMGRRPALRSPGPVLQVAPESRVHRGRPAQHGSRSMYVRGCRCDPCRDAERAYWRARNTKRREVA